MVKAWLSVIRVDTGVPILVRKPVSLNIDWKNIIKLSMNSVKLCYGIIKKNCSHLHWYSKLYVCTYLINLFIEVNISQYLFTGYRGDVSNSAKFRVLLRTARAGGGQGEGAAHDLLPAGETRHPSTTNRQASRKLLSSYYSLAGTHLNISN